MSKASKIFEANKETRLKNYETSLNRFYSQQVQNTVEKQLKDSNAKDQFRYNMQIRDQREEAKLEAFEKSEQTFVDQLIFNEQAEKEALLGEEKVFNERILATAFETDETNLAYQKQLVQSKFEFNRAERGIKEAAQDFQINRALLDLGAEQQTVEATSKRESLKLKSDQARASKNTEDYNNRIKALQAKGTARALGTRGKTADRMLQSITAMSGVNSALIADQLMKSDIAIAIEQEILKKQLGPQGFIETERGLRVTQARQKRDTTTKELRVQQNQVAKALGITTEQFNMSREQLGRSLLSAADSYERSVAKIQQKKYASDMAAYANRQLQPRVQPEIPAPFETPVPVLIQPPKPVKPVKSSTAGQLNQDTNPVLQGISGLAATVAAISPVFGPSAPVVAGVAGGISFGAQLLDKIF